MCVNVTQELAGLTHGMVTPSLYPRDCITARMHQLSRGMGSIGDFLWVSILGANCWSWMISTCTFLCCQGSHALNWKETTTAAPITAPIRTCHLVPQEDVMANVPYMCCSTQGTSTQCPTMSWPLRWPSFSQHRMPFLSKEPWLRLESSPFKPT